MLFKQFVLPVHGDLSVCSQRNKALAQGCGMEFNAAVMRIKDILRHSTAVGHDIFQDLDVFAISSTVPSHIYDMADCKGFRKKLSFPSGLVKSQL